MMTAVVPPGASSPIAFPFELERKKINSAAGGCSTINLLLRKFLPFCVKLNYCAIGTEMWGIQPNIMQIILLYFL
jgi:hypothetical protein